MKHRILLADDSADIRFMVRLNLESSGKFEIVGEATDGKEACELTDSLNPDAVVLDLAMPIMDGLQALEVIKRTHPSMIVVILSGFGRQQIGDATSAADLYLEKGNHLDTLVDGLTGLLAG